ncbi:MAG: phage tail sheath subtilisin-like domain-containing protein [Pseudomonadota bacterium]
MSTTYFSGVRASDHTIAPPVIRVGDAGDIGVVVTAPDRDTDKVALNRPFDIVGDFTKADLLGLSGTAALNLRHIWDQFEQQSGKMCVIPVPEVADPTQQKAAVIGDQTTKTGIYAFLDAEGTVGINPDCIIAPGFANAPEGNQADPVVGALANVGQKIRALAIADGPATTAADAISARQNYGYDNLVITDPGFEIFDTASDANVEIPLSTTVAGVQARTHLENGWWWSFDNKEIRGTIVGPSRPVDFRINDAGCEATHLKGNDITTVIRRKGFHLWGGHTADPARLMGGTTVGRLVSWKLYDALEEGLFPFIGVPGNVQAVPQIEGVGRKFLSDVKARGAIIDYTFSLPRDLNSATLMADGAYFYRLRFVEAAPIRAIEIYGYRTPEFYAEFLTQAEAANAFAAFTAQ